MLVDDREDDIELTLRAFKKAQIPNEIVIMRDGAEAVEFLHCTGKFAGRSPYDVPALILLDIKLPRRNGIQVLQSIRRLDGTKRVPVVMLTSSSEERDVWASYDSGANSYVRKPVIFSDFSDAIRQVAAYWLSLNQGPPQPLQRQDWVRGI